MSNKEITQLIGEATKQGWTVTRNKSNHLKWVSPGGDIVTSSSTPSDPRTILNTKRYLKRYGFIELKATRRRKR